MLAAEHDMRPRELATHRLNQVADQQPLDGEHAGDADDFNLWIDSRNDLRGHQSVRQYTPRPRNPRVLVYGFANGIDG